jgi:glycosyltransferase involved in cell wall biosynthesis
MKVLHLVTSRKSFFDTQINALLNEGIDIDIITVPGEHIVTENLVSNRTILQYLIFYSNVLKKIFQSYDVVHANHGTTAIIAMAQPRRPVVVSLWGNELNSKQGPLVKLATERSDLVIVMNNKTGEKLNNETRIIPHGVDTDLFRPINQEEAQAMLEWNQDNKHVLFPYAPARQVKNYPLAKEVVSDVDTMLDNEVELQTVYNVPHKLIPLYMNAADALLLTSKHEGSPNSVKEAMACNLPVVSTDVGDVKGRLHDLPGGIVGPTKDELSEGLFTVLSSNRDWDLRTYMGNATLEYMAEEIISVYEYVLDNG